MNAVIITPAYTHAHEDLERAIRESGIPWLPLYRRSDLPRARSVLIERALELGAERLLLVDADTVPTAATLRALAETADVQPDRALWGLYPLREGDRWSINPEDEAEADQAIREGRAFRIRTGGLGLCAIHRQSLERAAAELGLPTIVEENGASWRPFCVPFWREWGEGPFEAGRARYYADDGSLCWRLRESGTALWCDPTLRAGHAVTTVLRGLRAT